MESTHPALRPLGVSATIPRNAAPSSYVVNGDTSANYTTTTTTTAESPKSARGRSFSFLRRTKSSDPPAQQAPQRSLSQPRKLVRRRKSQKQEEQQRRREAEAANPIPHLPSYHALPSISNPYLIDSSQSQSFPPPQNQAQQQQFAQRSQLSSAPQPASPKRRGYNPAAYYQRHQQSMDRSLNPSAFPNLPMESPPGTANTDHHPPFDPRARNESMTNRGRMSYASSIVSQGTAGHQRRLRKKKEPIPFNVLVVGTKGCGKTSFIEFLRSSLSKPDTRFAASQMSPPATAATEQHGSFTSHYIRTQIDGERIGLTLYDSSGLERHVVDLQLRELSGFLESRFQETFAEEQKVMRTPGVKDTHIHCVLLLLDPARLDLNIKAASSSRNSSHVGTALTGSPKVIGGLDENLDVNVIRALQGKTTVIPVISKADTITTAHMAYLKRVIHVSLKRIKFDPIEALNLDLDADSDAGETPAHPEAENSDRDSSIFHDVAESHHDHDAVSTSEQAALVAPEPAIASSNTLQASTAPQHDEIRVSHLSTNVETPHLPMSIISPDVYEPGTIGRRFPWGFADPYNSEHCDFSRLKESVFSEWRAVLRETSRERWYEGWRTNQMRRRGQATRNYSTMPIRESTRAASGSAAYAHGARATPNGNTAQHRAVSSAEIGLAIGAAQ